MPIAPRCKVSAIKLADLNNAPIGLDTFHTVQLCATRADGGVAHVLDFYVMSTLGAMGTYLTVADLFK